MAEILDSKSQKITQFGGVGGQEWKFGGQNWFTRKLIRHVRPDWLLSNPSAAESFTRLEPRLESSHLGCTYAGSIFKKLLLGGVVQL
eukprot:1154358-Pelagomonas_calceolata.AAC.4